MRRDGTSEGDEELGETAAGSRGKKFRVGDREGRRERRGTGAEDVHDEHGVARAMLPRGWERKGGG